MGSLKDQVISDTLNEVRIVYLPRTVTQWWNARRDQDDTAAFCGWFWIHGTSEAGPFRTRSAAVRDAYYRFVLKRSLPTTGRAIDEMNAANIKRASRKQADQKQANGKQTGARTHV